MAKTKEKKQPITDLADIKMLFDTSKIRAVADSTDIPVSGEITPSFGEIIETPITRKELEGLPPDYKEKFDKQKRNEKFNKQLIKPKRRRNQNEK